MNELQIDVVLPSPSFTGKTPLEQLLKQRRSVREYQNRGISLAQLAQLLWAAQGITHPKGLRTAPSAGALYPLDLYVAVRKVEGLDPGVYHYQPSCHDLTLLHDGDISKIVARVCYGQSWVRDAAAIVIFAAIYERAMMKYGNRGIRYTHIETGHAAENLFLQALSLGLSTAVTGAFYDDDLKEILGLHVNVNPLLLMPVGYRE